MPKLNSRFTFVGCVIVAVVIGSVGYWVGRGYLKYHEDDLDLKFVQDELWKHLAEIYKRGRWSDLTKLSQMAVVAQDHALRMRIAAMSSTGVDGDEYGVTQCPIRRYAKWSMPKVDRESSKWPLFVPFPLQELNSSPHEELRGMSLLRVELQDATAIANGVHLAPCSSWKQLDSEKQLKRLSGPSRMVYKTAPHQEHVDIVVNTSSLLAAPEHSNICFVLHCPSMCNAGEHFCNETGAMTLTAPLQFSHEPGKPMEKQNQKVSTPRQEVLVMLLESLSWDVFNRSFPTTQSYLAELDQSNHHRVSGFVNSHATGQYTALNHPPFLFGRHTTVCSESKGLTVMKPCEKDELLAEATAKAGRTKTSLKEMLGLVTDGQASRLEGCSGRQWKALNNGPNLANIGLDMIFRMAKQEEQGPTELLRSGYKQSQTACDAPIHKSQNSSSAATTDTRLVPRLQQEGVNEPKDHHLLTRFKGKGFKTGYLAPLTLDDNVITCYGVQDESSAKSMFGVDDARIRFYHLTSYMGALHNGVQGCVGDRHEMDHQDEFIHSFFDDPNTSGYGKQQNKIAVLNHQVSHAGVPGKMGRYYDARLEQQVRHFIENAPEGVQRTVLLQADHGESVKADRHILNPVSIWITPRSGPFWERNGPVLHRRRHAVTSHFDEHATLLDFLERYPFDGKPEEKEDPPVPPRQVNCKANPMRHRLSMLDATIDVPLRRSCEDLGLFSHSCNLFDEVEVVGGGKGGGVINSERLRAGLVHLLTKRAAGYVSSMFAAPVATRHKNSSGDDEGAGREHFGPCQNLPQMMVSASTKPEAERFVEFESVSARLFSDGTCALAGRVALATKPRRSVFIFNVEPIVSLVEDGMSVEERARRCVTAFVRHRRKRVTQMIRVSRFAPDEDACGSKLESFWASLRAAATGKAKAPHMMYCVCDVRE